MRSFHEINNLVNLASVNFRKYFGETCIDIQVPEAIKPQEQFIWENLGIADIKYSEDEGIVISSTPNGIFIFLNEFRKALIDNDDEIWIEGNEITVGKKQIRVIMPSDDFSLFGSLVIIDKSGKFNRYIKFAGNQQEISIIAQLATLKSFIGFLIDLVSQNIDRKEFDINKLLSEDTFCINEDSHNLKIKILDTADYLDKYKNIPPGYALADKTMMSFDQRMFRNAQQINHRLKETPYFFQGLLNYCWKQQMLYEHEFNDKEIDRIVVKLFFKRWAKEYIIPPPLEHIWTIYRLVEMGKYYNRNISDPGADNLKYPLLPEDCMPEIINEIRQPENSDVVFPVFLTLEDTRILMFNNPVDLNNYMKHIDYRIIMKSKFRDIKGCLCRVKVKAKPIEREDSKNKPANEEFCFQPERISSVMDTQSLIDELYKYAISQSRRITCFSIRGYLEPGKSCNHIYEHISCAETAIEVEQMILDDIFETNFPFSNPSDEEIIKFYITFCGLI